MAHFFFDDGGPEAEDYASNYLVFDETKPECLRTIRNFIKKKAHLGGDVKETLRLELAKCAC